MTWKELVNFVDTFRETIKADTPLCVDADIHYIPLTTVLIADDSVCSRCNHKHEVILFRIVKYATNGELPVS